MNMNHDLFPETLPAEIAGRIGYVPHIVFRGIDIRQDAEGRYCLNDLHEASGNDPAFRPSKWLRNKRTKHLIEKISVRNKPKFGLILPVTEPKKKTPTYAVKTLLYHYAAWIDQELELLVYEVFDAVVSCHVEQIKRESNALYALRPRWLPIVTYPEYKRAALIELTGHTSPGSITACRRRMLQVGLLPGKGEMQ